MDFRPYGFADRDACMAVFDSNVPDYFGPEQRPVFEAWLDEAGSDYFVLGHEGAVLACGGFALPATGATDARLVWPMVARAWQRQGIGRFLLMYCLREATRRGKIVETVSVEVPPGAAPFFHSQGFRTAHVTPEEGQILLVRKLSVCP